MSTTSDLPAPPELIDQLTATYRALVAHHAACPGCQNRLRCPIYAALIRDEQATLDATCRTMLGTT